MVKALLVLCILGTFNLFASETSYTLESSVSKEAFQLKIITNEIFQSSCELAVVRMNITQAIGLRNGGIELLVKPTTFCNQANGPHSMIFILPRGKALPKIPNGFYQIWINGVFYQIISILPDRGSETGNG